MNEIFLAIYCCAYTIQWHHLDSTLRRGARGSSIFWLDFSASDLGLSRSCPRAACFLFKMYGCVNVCVCTYNPTSIGSLKCICIHIHRHTYIHVHTYTHALYTHTCTHIYIRMHMHTYAQIENLRNNASTCQAI